MNSRQGQSSVEIVVALGILAVALGAAVMMIFGGQSLTLNSAQSNVALRLARQEIERSRAAARNDFAGLVAASSTADGFTREIFVETLDPYRKEVTVRVSWDTNPLRAEQVELVTLVTDARRVLNTEGDTGGGATTGDWRNPQTLGTIDLGPGNAATGLDVFQKFIYLTAAASDTKKPDFFVVDARNGQSVSILGQLDTGDGLLAIDTAGTIAFVGNSSSTAQLQIIDVSTRNAPVLRENFQLPGVSGAGAVGRSIFYSGGKIYIGTDQATGPEFHVVDVSDPLEPAHLGSFEINADVNSIRVLGDLAYLATSDNSKELRILNVSDPGSINEAGSYNANGSADANSIHLAGNTLYLGRESGTDKEILLIGVAVSASTTLVGSREIGADVNSLYVRDDLVFMGTSDSNKEFQVWDSSDPANLEFWSSFNFPQVAAAIDYEDNLVYVAVRSNDAVRIITSGQ